MQPPMSDDPRDSIAAMLCDADLTMTATTWLPDRDDLRTRIMAVLRERGWTCEYHEPVAALGECGQCDDSHGKTADAVIRECREYLRCTSCDGCVNCDWTFR